ncbi:MAG: hypothetical protein J7J61_05525 [Candidatus Hydrothermae bacterium]|nr:hypothetical protein [Candidatus Hydrothermae bacterium]
MIRKWVKLLPYVVVKRIVQWLECTYYVTPREELYLWEIDDGEYLLLSEEKYKEMKAIEEEKRKKKLEKARKKLYKILEKYPELREELKELKS